MHVTKVFEKNGVGFHVVMVGNPKTITKRSPHHFFQSLGHMTYYKTQLNCNFMFLQK